MCRRGPPSSRRRRALGSVTSRRGSRHHRASPSSIAASASLGGGIRRSRPSGQRPSAKPGDRRAPSAIGATRAPTDRGEAPRASIEPFVLRGTGGEARPWWDRRRWSSREAQGSAVSGPQGVTCDPDLEAPLGSTLRHDTRCSTSNRPARTVSRGIGGGAPEEGVLDRSATERIRCSRVTSEAARPKGVFRGRHHPGPARGSARERECSECSSRSHERQTSKEWPRTAWPPAPASSAISTSSAVRTRTEPHGSRTWSFDEGRSNAGASWERGSSRGASRSGRPGWGRAPRGKVKVGLRKASICISLPARRSRAGPAAPGRYGRYLRPVISRACSPEW